MPAGTCFIRYINYKRQNKDQLETRSCEQITKLFHRDLTNSVEIIKSRNYYKIVKKINIERAPWKGFAKQAFKASVHPKKFWLRRYKVTL